MEKHVSYEGIEPEAQQFADSLAPRADGATVVTLSGELGAGKTTFVQALARAYGIEEGVTSPTFVIQKIYPTTKGPFSHVIHIDAYRINDPHELEVLGWARLLEESKHLILLEWPERVSRLIPKSAEHISFKHIDDTTRAIHYEKETVCD